MKKLTTLLMIAVFGIMGNLKIAFAQAELQVIHNCADPAAANVDVYVDGTLALDDFAFRTATPFLPLPSGVNIEVGIAPANSMGVDDTLVNYTVNLMANTKYIAIASGVLAPASFAVNPDGLNTAFTLNILSNAQVTAVNPQDVDIAINHGSTDAPTVDIIARHVATLVDDAAYGAITGYIPVTAADYIIDITPGNDNSTIVASFGIDLTPLAGGAAVVFASGFLDPSINQNGESFGLFAALPTGTVVPLNPVSQARLQVIHNAADPGAATVDVYLNGALALDDFTFRDATPFIDVPGDVPVNIGIAPPNSNSVNDTLVNFTATFTNGETYLAVANGVLTPGSFAPNPDGISTAFTLLLQNGIRESAVNAGDVDFVVLHGSTDAPTVDVLVNGGGPVLVDDAAYTDLTSYLSVPASLYNLDLTPGNDNSTIIATYQADLSTLAGGAAVVFASGFLNPGSNQNGPGFGVWVALPDGSTFPLNVVTSIADQPQLTQLNIYPNPVNKESEVNISLEPDDESKIDVMDATGRIVLSKSLEGVQSFRFSTAGFNSGIYLIRISGSNSVITKRLTVN